MADLLLELGKKVIGAEPKAGKLKGWSKDLPSGKRRESLKKVVRKDGCGTAIRRLNLIAVYSKRTSPETTRKARSDITWLKKQGFCRLA